MQPIQYQTYDPLKKQLVLYKYTHFYVSTLFSSVFGGRKSRPEALVTVTDLEIDKSTTQSLWGLPDIHLPKLIHRSHFLSYLALNPLFRTHSLSASI